MEITTILFDLGGTIEDIVLDLNSQDACIDVIQQFLQCHDNEFAIDRSLFHHIVKDGFLRYKQWSINSCREQSGEEIWGDWIFSMLPNQRSLFVEVGNLLTDLWETLFYRRSLKPDATEMLKNLAHDGYRLGVISNTTSRDMPPLLMKKYGIDSYFECFLLSSLEGIRKPDPEIFLRAAQKLVVDPQECVYVGDQANRDCFGSHEAGFASNILIESPMTTTHKQDDSYVKNRITKLSEVPLLLREIKEKQ